jgi:hypothetical protein
VDPLFRLTKFPLENMLPAGIFKEIYIFLKG